MGPQYTGDVPDLSLYVRSTPLAEVERIVADWQKANRPLAVNIEEADEFPGFTVAIDIEMADEAELRRVIRELAGLICDAVPEWQLRTRHRTAVG